MEGRPEKGRSEATVPSPPVGKNLTENATRSIIRAIEGERRESCLSGHVQNDTPRGAFLHIHEGRTDVDVPRRSTICPQRQLVEPATWRSAGRIFSGRGGPNCPERPTECRMGESPDRGRRPRTPGTQGAQRPSSLRRGRERARVPEECDLERCAEVPLGSICHPARPEPETWLCAYHLKRAKEALGVTA